MRPANKEHEYEPRTRSPRRRKSGRKTYGIEFRMIYDPSSPRLRHSLMDLLMDRKRKSIWRLWKRYRTKKQRDDALEGLRNKGPHDFEKFKLPIYEYRKEPEVKFVPLHDNIVVEYDEPKDRTDGGILLPDICKILTMEALVVSVGPGRRASNGKMIPMPCQVGQKVLVSFSGIEMDNPDSDSKKKIRLVSAEDILAVR